MLVRTTSRFNKAKIISENRSCVRNDRRANQHSVWARVGAEEQKTFFRHKELGLFRYLDGFRMARVGNYTIRDDARVVSVDTDVDDQSRGKVLASTVVKRNEFALFRGHFANISKIADVIDDHLPYDYNKLDPMDLPNTFHTGRRWLFARTEAVERLLVAFDLHGESISLQRESLDVVKPEAQSSLQRLQSDSQNSPAWQLEELKGFVVGFHSLLHLKTVDHYRKNKIVIPELNEFEVTPYVHTYLPIHQDYIELCNRVLESINIASLPLPYLNAGCGTGLLALILADKMKRRGIWQKSSIVCTDMSQYALKCTQENVKNYLQDNASVIETLCADVYPQNDQKFGLIVSYPPYIPVTTVRNLYEASMYDQGERMLNILFSQLPARLARGGKFVLIYPTVATDVLHLRPADHIEKLCQRYNLHVVEKVSAPADKPDLPPTLYQFRDPTLIYRKKSIIQAFVIERK